MNKTIKTEEDYSIETITLNCGTILKRKWYKQRGAKFRSPEYWINDISIVHWHYYDGVLSIKYKNYGK